MHCSCKFRFKRASKSSYLRQQKCCYVTNQVPFRNIKQSKSTGTSNLRPNPRNKYVYEGQTKLVCLQVATVVPHAIKTISQSLFWSSETLNSRQQSPTVLCCEYSTWVNSEEREEAFLYTVAPRGPQCGGNMLPDFLPPVFTSHSLRRSLHHLMHNPLIVKKKRPVLLYLFIIINKSHDKIKTKNRFNLLMAKVYGHIDHAVHCAVSRTTVV